MTVIAGYEVHPAAELFPMFGAAEFDALVADIAETEQRDPIVLDHDGLLIDGRNRARACEQLGLVPTTRVYDGDDVWSYVVSCNLHRRHLTDSQRAMVAAKLATRARGGISGMDRATGDITHCPPSVPQAAVMLGVGETSVKKARQVIREGTPELQELVSTGVVAVNTAARVAEEMTKAEQDDFVDRVQCGEDPIRAAPPKIAKPKPQPPKGTNGAGTRRTHRAQLDAMANGMSGYALLLGEVTDLDESVTAEEAARIRGDLFTSIQSFNRILRLLKERTS